MIRKVQKFFFIILISMFLLVSCVRYNTFYHARETYLEEEEKRLERTRIAGTPPLPGTEDKIKKATTKKSTKYNNKKSKSNSTYDRFDNNRSKSTGYSRVVEKCAKIITLHPKSEWVDDAIILMGNAYLKQGEFENALRKYDELIIYYPKSKFVSEAEFNKGYSHYLSEDYETAISNLIAFIEKYPKSDWTDDAYYYLGNSYFVQENYDKAAENYDKLSYYFPKSEWGLNAAYFRGNALFRIENYDQAIIAFKQVIKLDPLKELEMEARYNVGKCNLKLGNYELAYQLFYELFKYADKKNEPELKAKAELKMVQSYRYLIDAQETISKLRKIILDYNKYDVAGEAQLEIGDIYQTELDSLEKAKQAYDDVRKYASKDSETAKIALEKSASLAQLAQFQNLLDADSEQEVAKTQFLLAEVYYFQMDEVDSALIQYSGVVKNYPQSEYAPKSLYALGWIYEENGEEAKAQEFYQDLIDSYPKTAYANFAREKLGLELIDIEEKITDITLFHKAEKYLDEDQPDSAKFYYEKVLQMYPDSQYSSKAAYGIGWLYEYQYKNQELAVEQYKIVQDSFPGTPEAAHVAKRLNKNVQQDKTDTQQDNSEKPEQEKEKKVDDERLQEFRERQKAREEERKLNEPIPHGRSGPRDDFDEIPDEN